MKHLSFEVRTDGFHGAYWACREAADCAIIAAIGDASDDYLVRSCAKWAMQQGVNVLTLAPEKKECGYHNFPLEQVAKAIAWLQAHGNRKIGMAGASTTGTMALAAASFFPDITLTVAMTPSDFIWQGFMRGKRDGCSEWPISGESLLSCDGKPLPFMPFVYQHPQYWHCIQQESKRGGDMINSKKLFDDSEKAHPITEDEFIKVEKIKGRLLLIGAEDDVLWSAAKYIRRMEQRLSVHPHDCTVEAVVYPHATHFVFPESLLKTILPVGSGLLAKLAFSAARKYPKECREARIDIDRRVTAAIRVWKAI